jgi:Family of unknown function (DUF6056)
VGVHPGAGGAALNGPRTASGRGGRWLRFALPLLVVAGVMGALNGMTPRIADDYAYLTSSVHEAARGAWADYVHWNGRLVGQGLARLFLLLDKRWFDVLNTLAFVVLVVVVAALGRGRLGGERWPELIGGTFFLLWFGTPGFGDATLWTVGSANYLWTTMLLLLFLVPYGSLARGRPAIAPGPFRACLFGVFSIAAGWTSENTAGAVLALAAAAVVSARRRGTRVPGWSVAGLAGGAAGYAALLLAPGNQIRLGTGVNRALSTVPLAARLERFVPTLLGASAALWPLWLAFGLALWLGRRAVGWNEREWRGARRIGVAVACSAALAVLAMVAAPALPVRALTGAATLLAVATVCAAAPACARLGRLRPFVGGTALVMLAISVGGTLRDFARLDAKVATRRALVERALSLGLHDVSLPPIVVRRSRQMFWGRIEDISYNPQYWTNRTAARAWGLSSVQLIPPGRDEPLLDLGDAGRVVVGRGGLVTAVLFSPACECLVLHLRVDDPRPLSGSFLDLRVRTDRTSWLRRAVNAVRTAVLPSSSGDEIEYPHDLLRKAMVFFSFDDISVFLDATRLTCADGSCTAFAPLPEPVARFDEVYVGWRRTADAPMVLHRLRRSGRRVSSRPSAPRQRPPLAGS